MKRNKNMLALILCLLVLYIIYLNRSTKVYRVIDGDTFITNKGDIIRMIGIDAPELQTLQGIESKMYLYNLIKDKTITLQKDNYSHNEDKYGRLLRYVYLNGQDVNLLMLKKGYAKQYNYFYFNKFKQYNSYE
mgnify:FL=1|tara:strand:- start:26 stop:424 length:399 start_codon:yes stop_codon:yes gene_type:complete